MEGFKEVSKGIWEPTEPMIIEDEKSWFEDNVGYGYVTDLGTNKVLLVFALRGTEDVVAFAHKRFHTNVGFRCGFPDLGDYFLGGLCV